MKISSNSTTAALLLGSNGAVIASDTATYTGSFYALKAVTQCVINTATFDGTISGSLNGVTVIAGDTLMLYRFLTVKLTSGVAILYKAEG